MNPLFQATVRALMEARELPQRQDVPAVPAAGLQAPQAAPALPAGSGFGGHAEGGFHG